VEKKELWVALSALGVMAASGDAPAAPERAGVAGQVNPAAEGRLSGSPSRVLFVGSDIFRNETIHTDAGGLVHLLFLDQSALTVGPNSDLVIDRFVYDPDAGSGQLTLSAAKGVFRFVGGALSKAGKVNVKTPAGNLGIRGAVVVVQVHEGEGTTNACILYGDELTATIPASGVSKALRENEQCLRITADGRIELLGPVDPNQLRHLLAALTGPERENPPQPPGLALPPDFSAWLRELANQQDADDTERAAVQGVDVINRDVDSLGS
jgi:hypothetical protein